MGNEVKQDNKKKGKILKLAIFSPSSIPIPALEGGAVEELVTYIINANEKQHIYDIDLYTIEDDRLSSFNYKYTKIIPINYKKNPQRDNYYSKLNRILRRLPHGRVITNFSEVMTKRYRTNYYDAVLIEDNRNIFNSVQKKLTKEKVYFHIHDDLSLPQYRKHVFWNKLKNPEDLNLINGIIDSSTKIITVSHYLENRFLNFGAQNIVTLYNGVISNDLCRAPKKNRNYWRKKLNIEKEDFVFTFVGRFTQDKGIDKLLLAFNLLHEFSNMKCVIVSKKFKFDKDNGFSKKLRSIYSNLSDDVKNRIVFTGYVDHKRINEIYSITDCLVIPSQYEEAFGVVALEGMTMSLPIIASDSGGLPEVLNEKCAFIIKRNNNFVVSLSEAMYKIYSQPNLRVKMGIAGKKRSNLFPKTGEEYFNNFKKIVK